MNSHHIRSDVWVVLQLDSTIRLGPFPLGTFYHSRFSVHKTGEPFCSSGCSFSPDGRGEGTAPLAAHNQRGRGHFAAQAGRAAPGGPRQAGAAPGGLFRSAGPGSGLCRALWRLVDVPLR